MRVKLLGRFTVTLGEECAGPWPRPRAKRLCALVFLSSGRRVSREVACEALFPSLTPLAAAGSLRNALSMARGVLARLGGSGGRHAQRRSAHIYICPGALVEVDLELQQQALGSALSMKRGPDRDASLTQALADQACLLEDEPYSDWALRPRESLEQYPPGSALGTCPRPLGRGRPLGARVRRTSLGGLPGPRAGIRRRGRRLDAHLCCPRSAPPGGAHLPTLSFWPCRPGT